MWEGKVFADADADADAADVDAAETDWKHKVTPERGDRVTWIEQKASLNSGYCEFQLFSNTTRRIQQGYETGENIDSSLR